MKRVSSSLVESTSVAATDEAGGRKREKMMDARSCNIMLLPLRELTGISGMPMRDMADSSSSARGIALLGATSRSEATIYVQ